MSPVTIGVSIALPTWPALSGRDEVAAVASEQPAFCFTHSRGKGKAGGLVKGLKSALDARAKAGKVGGH